MSKCTLVEGSYETSFQMVGSTEERLFELALIYEEVLSFPSLLLEPTHGHLLARTTKSLQLTAQKMSFVCALSKASNDISTYHQY